MGKELADAFACAREVFEEIDDALDQELSAIMWGDDPDTLTLTENAQPALMAVSLGVMAVLEREAGIKVGERAAFVVGHSLGEYSALAAAGVFSLADTARLLKTRGRAMQKAVPVGEGAMAALLGLDLEKSRAVADEASRGEVCEIANDNAPGQVVLSGHKTAIDRAVEIARTAGARRAILLPVSAPFHCSLMEPAARAMEAALGETVMSAPAVPLIANISASPVTSPEAIREGLVAQVTGTVRWTESVGRLSGEGVDTLVELGAGKVLTGLARRINRNLKASAIGTPADIEAFLAAS
jgi:[acyl-carrier-protein] S-malonyltransferase